VWSASMSAMASCCCCCLSLTSIVVEAGMCRRRGGAWGSGTIMLTEWRVDRLCQCNVDAVMDVCFRLPDKIDDIGSSLCCKQWQIHSVSQRTCCKIMQRPRYATSRHNRPIVFVRGSRDTSTSKVPYARVCEQRLSKPRQSCCSRGLIDLH